MKLIKKITLVLFLVAFSFGVYACKKDESNYSLNLKANKEMAFPGETVQFNTEIVGDQVSVAIQYEIQSGANYATIDANGLLTIKNDAQANAEIIVVAKAEAKVSNSVKVKVARKLESITLSAETTKVVPGNNVVLNTSLQPANADGVNVRYEVIQGQEACSMVNNLLVVNHSAAIGTVIKVKAVSGSVESNVLELEVISGKSDKLFVSLSNSTLVVDKFAGSTSLLEATIYDSELNVVEDKKVIFEVISGSEFLAVSFENNLCSLEALGHGEAVVRATIEGTNYSQTAKVTVIVPPTALELHDVFADRVGYEYNFSKVDALPFPIQIIGENACEDIVFAFKDQQGNSGDAVATYDPETGKITFNSTGKVTVTATSASGSRNEASISYTFNINEGINVYNYEQLKATLEGADYNGQIVNIVVLDKPTTTAYNYEYGYDLVPSFALKAKEEQTFANLTSEKLGNISVYNKNVYLNGNQHKIDLTNVRNFTNEEYTTLGWSQDVIDPALEITHSTGGLQLDVKLYDLTILGNCSIDYQGDLSGKTPVGAYYIGLSIGNPKQDIFSAYFLDCQNVTLAQLNTGMRVYHVVNNGLVKNINVYNCFGNGIESYANIITFENMTFGPCGAAGIEIVPDYDKEAGTSFNQQQHVTFAGSITTTNYSNGNSLYMQNFSAGGVGVMTILQGVFSQYPDEVLSNIRNEKGEFAFISFVFNDLNNMNPNESIYEYKNIDGAGIVNINSLTGIDTTHKYIEVEVLIPGLGSVGKVLVYNFNYQGK